MKFFKDFFSSLKGIYIEELLDLFIFRPVAYLFVRILYLTPITPNQISFLAMISGVVSGIFYAQGNYDGFIIGAIFFAFSNVLDCADGMIARLKHNGTKTGRIIDGLVDYITNISVYIGLAIGLSKIAGLELEFLGYGPFDPVFILILAAASTALHACVTDYYRNRFDAYVNNKKSKPEQAIAEFSEELERLKKLKGKYFDRFIIKIYLIYSRIQSRKPKKQVPEINKNLYFRKNRFMLMLWNLIGMTTHISVLVFATLVSNFMIFFIYTIIIANIWLIILFIIQQFVNKSMIKQMSNEKTDKTLESV